ncbi:hypothetical protein NC652_040234 [Populus alba x Populus x berolinensis]|nr:hypothetical protein NC652_040234 [Populus alba x Populus x berolinensis]
METGPVSELIKGALCLWNLDKNQIRALNFTPMAGNSKLHIAMFPWLAFGHMIPFLELAKLIAQKGHKISFISTPRNIDRLPKLHPSVSPLITFVKLSLPQVENLPKDAEATTDVPYDKVQYLKQAFDDLKEPLSKFLETCDDLDCILFDFAPYWLPDIATSLGIISVFFSIFTAAMLSYVKPASDVDDRSKPEDFTVPPKWVTFPTNVVFRLFEVLRIFYQTIAGNVVSDFYRAQEGVKGCDMIAVRSCMEFEPEWLQLLEEIHGKPVIPVGVLATTEYDTGVLEDKKMGYSIPRNEKNGYFTRDSVAESLRLVMEKEEGKIYRDKVKEMKPLFADKDRQDKLVTMSTQFLDFKLTQNEVFAAYEHNPPSMES